MSKKTATETPDEQAKRTAMEDKVFKRKALAIPLILLPLAFGTYIATTKGPSPVWWHLHPIAMMFGYVTVAGNAITTKKVGGFTNTQIHGYLMFLMGACACFGGYVMWSNKEAANRPHYTTTHSYIGGTVLATTALYPVFSWVLYNPSNGILRTNTLFRTIHKWSGRAMIATAYAAIATGIYTVEKDPMKQAGMSELRAQVRRRRRRRD